MVTSPTLQHSIDRELFAANEFDFGFIRQVGKKIKDNKAEVNNNLRVYPYRKDFSDQEKCTRLHAKLYGRVT